MESLYLYLSIIILAIFIISGVEFILGCRSIKFLKDVEPYGGSGAPKISVIVPACNEERNIEKALQSLINQDYPNYEVIVVNDRSTDRTGIILDAMSGRYSQLQVHHVSELPPGWLGKNHALHYGVERADGKYLLFTDADVVMHPSTLGRAINYMISNNLDHLAVSPEIVARKTLLKMFIGTFAVFLFFYLRPWKAKSKKSKNFFGVGAFNLVRKEAYTGAGTHKKIAMRPDDDLKLGKIIKKCGYSQDILYGRGLISIEWYLSLKDAINGLMKNAFAGIEYNVAALVLVTIMQLLFDVWPFLAVFITGGVTRVIYIIIVLIILYIYRDHARYHALPRWHGIGFPLSVLLYNFTNWRAVFLALKNRGITWRGTHYSLRELKANKV